MAVAQKMIQSFPLDPQDRVRADFYGLLARLLYAAADAGLLEGLAGSGELEAEAVGASFPAAWNELRRAAKVAVAEAVRAEYDETFIGVGKPQVMLYGSYYLAGFLNEKPLAALRSDLAALGVTRQSGASEPEDHIAALADVMRQLILDEDNAPADRDAAQQLFFTRHIEPWYGSLCVAVEAASGVDFYRSVAGLARAFFDLESEFFRIG